MMPKNLAENFSVDPGSDNGTILFTDEDSIQYVVKTERFDAFLSEKYDPSQVNVIKGFIEKNKVNSEENKD